MIVPDKMQDAVNEQLGKTGRKRDARLTGFPLRGICGNDDITEKQRIDIGEIAFLHGKGDDVGRSLVMQVMFVDLGDFLVVDDQNGKFVIRISQGV